MSPRELAKAIVGMASASGGLVAVGVSESGPSGMDPADPKAQALVDQATRFTVPPVRTQSRFAPLPQGHVLLVEVEASQEVHALTNDESYLRVGAETRRLTFVERQELVYDKGQSFFDVRPVEGATSRDLDLEALKGWAAAAEASSPTGLAVTRGLLADENTPTVAGILVFGRRPQTHLPESLVRVIRHRGTEARTGRQMAVELDERMEGPLPEMIDRAVGATTRLVPAVERLGAGGRFVKESLYPPFALREAITNAVVHRSYSLGGDHIRVSVFDDRIEVESPGRLPGLVREDNIRRTRFARNPHIARAMAELAYGREFGEGVDRMFREMAAVGLPEPTIRQGEASVRVTLLGDPALHRISSAVPPPGGARLAEHLHRFGRITTREAQELLGVGRVTAIKRLRALVDLGLLEWVASSPTDPTGYWRLGEHPARGDGT